MADTRRTSNAWVAYVLLGTWAMALIVPGILFTEEPWGVVLLAAGGLTVLAALLGMILWTWLEAAFGALFVAAGGLIGGGVVLADPVVSAAGVLALVLVGSLTPVTVYLRRLAHRPVPKVETRAASATDPEWARELHAMHETMMLSDNAKRVLFRQRELEMFRHAIEEDIGRGEYDAALTLCDAMADLFGQREEAERYREQIGHVRQERYDTQVRAALDDFNALLASRDWSRIHAEAARLRRLFPESHLGHELDHRIAAARNEHKRSLERQFLEASEADDTETAMALLRDLDRYMGRDESDRLSKAAQSVITRHRHRLGESFRDAVGDKRWADAAHIGETIVAEFPNSKMADEVRSMIEVIRNRATQAAVEASSAEA